MPAQPNLMNLWRVKNCLDNDFNKKLNNVVSKPFFYLFTINYSEINY